MDGHHSDMHDHTDADDLIGTQHIPKTLLHKMVNVVCIADREGKRDVSVH